MPNKNKTEKVILLTEDPTCEYEGDLFIMRIVSGGKRYAIVAKPKTMFAAFGSAKRAIRRWFGNKGALLHLLPRDRAG